jgi:hypothetical protein
MQQTGTLQRPQVRNSVHGALDLAEAVEIGSYRRDLQGMRWIEAPERGDDMVLVQPLVVSRKVARSDPRKVP